MITRPRTVRRPAFYEKYLGAWRNPYRDNALKFLVIGHAVIRHSASTDTLLRCRTYTAAQICQELNRAGNCGGLWRSPPFIRGFSLLSQEDGAETATGVKSKQKSNNTKTRYLNNRPHIATKQISKGVCSHACINVCLRCCDMAGFQVMFHCATSKPNDVSKAGNTNARAKG